MEKPFKINPQHTKNSPIRIYIQGTKNSPIFESDENENHFIDWETINIWVNGRKKVVPKLWLLWVIVDNIHFQHGFLKVWEHAEAYYGLSNGIGFFPSILNFGWLKIGIGDVHFNIINVIIHCAKDFVKTKKRAFKKNEEIQWVWFLLGSILCEFLIFNILLTGIHLFSVKIFNGIKIKFISIGGIIGKLCLGEPKNNEKSIHSWYHHIVEHLDNIHPLYMILSPRIEIKISELINYFKNL